MKKFIIFYIILTFFMMIGVTFAGEKYCFDCMHKYRIGDKKNETYEFDSDLESTVYVSFRNSIGRKQDIDLTNLVKEQISDRKTGLVSYILLENNKILIDENRKSKYTGPYPSHSIGKSLVSLVTGYAQCGGYLNHTVFDSIDYPTVAGTLYENQKLINLLNMQAGDDKIVGQRIYAWDNPIKGKGPNVNTIPIKKVMKKYFKGVDGLEPGTYYNYSAMTTNVIMNYVIYKTGDDWNKLLHKIFVEDAKVAKRVYFHKTLRKDKTGNRKSGEYGRYSFYADRYDYVRIANLMLNHWKNDTCVGKYLKTIFDRQEKKDGIRIQTRWARSYAGMFQTNYELFSKKRPVMGMHGRGGQHIVIDFERSRIVVTNAIYEDYNYSKIVYDPIKKGK